MTISIDPMPRATYRPSDAEHVVLLDERGRPSGTMAKTNAHHHATPFHLAFSCHVVGPDGRLLLSRRALTKRTWPGWWTNSCCGHPQVGETLRAAVIRRLDEELGLVPLDLDVAIADFAYRAAMPDGTTEHELCPVLIASVAGQPVPDPTEVDDVEWVTWPTLVQRACREPHTLSPWCVEQVSQLTDAGLVPGEWLAKRPERAAAVGLDKTVELPVVVPSASSVAWPVPSGLAIASASGDAQACGPGDAIAGQLQAVLGGFLDEKARGLAIIGPSLAPIAQEVRLLVDAGGKRLRPTFAYWGHRATGADHDEAVLRPAAAIELLHTFALIHDDVMDRSVTRRGRPSAFAALAERHRHETTIGDSDWFGISAAMLVGDLAFVWADELFDSCALEPDAVARARRVFTTLRTEVIAGQYLDLALAANDAAAEEGARQVALLKSARYTVTRPLLLGAALAPEHAAHGVDRALHTYGDAVGLAFQMRDDILGVFGDPVVTGKSCLDDLRDGKRTLLALRALRLADGANREVLSQCLGDPCLDGERADRCREVIAHSGALASIERLIAHQHELAVEAIAGLEQPSRFALEQLAANAVERQR